SRSAARTRRPRRSTHCTPTRSRRRKRPSPRRSATRSTSGKASLRMTDDLDELSLAFMDETPVPARGAYTRRHKAPQAASPAPPPKRGGGRRLSREEAEESLAAYIAKHGDRGTRKAYAALGDDTTFSRFVKTG